MDCENYVQPWSSSSGVVSSERNAVCVFKPPHDAIQTTAHKEDHICFEGTLLILLKSNVNMPSKSSLADPLFACSTDGQCQSTSKVSLKSSQFFNLYPLPVCTQNKKYQHQDHPHIMLCKAEEVHGGSAGSLSKDSQ